MDRHTGMPGTAISVSVLNLARLRVRPGHTSLLGRPVGGPCLDTTSWVMGSGDS